MAVDSNIGSLPKATSVNDDSLLVMEQQGEAKHFEAQLLKNYAKQGVDALVAAAQKAADDAAQAARDAKAAADSVEDVSADAAAAKAAAQAATQAMVAAQNARDAAQLAATLAADDAATKATQGVENKLTGYVVAAENAKDAAQSAAGTAATDAANAVNSQLAQHVADAQAAQKAAEQARDEAQAIAGGDFLPTSGGTMDGPIDLNPATAYIRVKEGSITTFTNPKMFNVYSGATVGTIAINVGKLNSFLALDFSVASYNVVMDLKFSGYTYTSSTIFHSPMVGGAFNGFGNYSAVSARFRAAVDNEGSRYFLIGDVDTSWGGYLRGAITKLIRMGGTNTPDVGIQLITDESHITWQQELPLRSSIPVEVDLLNKPIPIEKGGTNATSAADALAALGAFPATGGTMVGASGDTPLTLKSAAEGAFLGFKNKNDVFLGYLGFDANKNPYAYIGNTARKLYHEGYKPSASDVGAPTVKEMNTAISNAVGDINTILDEINGEVV